MEQNNPILEKTDIITFNGDVGVFTDEVVEKMLEKYFDHFIHISNALLILSSNTKTAIELMNELANEKENIIISFPNACEFIPNSFKVLFINQKSVPKSNILIVDQYDCIVILDPEKSHREVVEHITVNYGYWSLGKRPEKIIV